MKFFNGTYGFKRNIVEKAAVAFKYFQSAAGINHVLNNKLMISRRNSLHDIIAFWNHILKTFFRMSQIISHQSIFRGLIIGVDIEDGTVIINNTVVIIKIINDSNPLIFRPIRV